MPTVSLYVQGVTTASLANIYEPAIGTTLYGSPPAATSAAGVEIAVVGVNSHPDASMLADFRLID
ncbi:MAG: hypothetical protein PHW13_13000 [Methylococcales bacterium]|nr:hypothetical protein [Methylococcales bacterium]